MITFVNTKAKKIHPYISYTGATINKLFKSIYLLNIFF